LQAGSILNLSIGITELTPEWNSVLTQIGVQFELLNSEEELKYFKVIIVPSQKIPFNKNAVNDFVEQGGSILTCADAAGGIFKIKKRKVYTKYAVPQEKGLFYSTQICDIYSSSKVISEANYLKNQNENNIIYARKIGDGNIVVLPEDFVSLLFDDITIRKNFISIYSERFPNERVSRVSKAEIAVIIRKSLEHLFHCAKLPFVHLWFFPNGEPTVFNFRIDSDFGTEKEVFDLYNILDKHDITGTWFIEAKSKEKWLSKFNNFTKQELAYHCYRHKTTKSKTKNTLDFEKGLKLFKENGLIAKGYAAPYGEWNNNTGQLSEKFGFEYSSEFGYAYDGLPFFPLVNGVQSKVLQIPIHPISTNRLKHAGTSSYNLIKYFSNVIDRKISNFEPLFFYTHPFEKEYDFFNSLFEMIGSKNIHKISLIEYSNWWKERLNKNWKIDFENGNFKIITDNNDDSYFLRVAELSGEDYLIILKSGSGAPSRVKLNNSLPEKVAIDYKQFRKYSYKMFKHDILFKLRKLRQ
jgi:hypothetical protein